jgi:dTDP-4-amino-4,6-dideoxygalactose transaminase
LSNICAGIGRGQMEVLDERVRLRRDNHSFYKELFSNTEAVDVFSEANSDFFQITGSHVLLLIRI